MKIKSVLNAMMMAVLVFGPLGMVGCKKKSKNSTNAGGAMAPAPQNPITLEGEWWGNTSTGQRIGFLVESGEVTAMTHGGSACSNNWSNRYFYGGELKISASDNSFSTRSGSELFSGRFTSATSATGQLNATSIPGCAGGTMTWSVTKETTTASSSLSRK